MNVYDHINALIRFKQIYCRPQAQRTVLLPSLRNTTLVFRRQIELRNAMLKERKS